VQGYLDGVRLHLHYRGDLLRSEVGAVPQRDELLVALLELGDRARDVHPLLGLLVQLVEPGRVSKLGFRQRSSVGDHIPRNAYQPRERLTLPQVEAVAIADCAFKCLRGDVLGVGPVTNSVCDICVDTRN
jgi:hypothetical protein